MTLVFETIGWIGSSLLIICGVPLAYESWKMGRSHTFQTKMGTLFLWFWFWGEFFTLLYVLSFNELKWPLIIMSALNIFLISVILKYLYFPRNK